MPNATTEIPTHSPSPFPPSASLNERLPSLTGVLEGALLDKFSSSRLPEMEPLGGALSDKFSSSWLPEIEPLGGALSDKFSSSWLPEIEPLGGALSDKFSSSWLPGIESLGGALADKFSSSWLPEIEPLGGALSDKFSSSWLPEIEPLGGALSDKFSSSWLPEIEPLGGALSDKFPSSWLPEIEPLGGALSDKFSSSWLPEIEPLGDVLSDRFSSSFLAGIEPPLLPSASVVIATRPTQTTWDTSRVNGRSDTDHIDLSRDLLTPKETPNHNDLYDMVVMDEGLRRVSRRLFSNGHYVEAVERAYIYVNNQVKAKSGLTDQDGHALMRMAFSANSPVLMLNEFKTISHKDEQRGYMDIFAGVMTGIRNPRAHEHDLVDSPDTALELLVFANHLVRKVKESKTAG